MSRTKIIIRASKTSVVRRIITICLLNLVPLCRAERCPFELIGGVDSMLSVVGAGSEERAGVCGTDGNVETDLARFETSVFVAVETGETAAGRMLCCADWSESPTGIAADALAIACCCADGPLPGMLPAEGIPFIDALGLGVRDWAAPQRGQNAAFATSVVPQFEHVLVEVSGVEAGLGADCAALAA